MKICVIFGGAASDNIKSFYVKDGTMYDFKNNKPHIFQCAYSPEFTTQIWNYCFLDEGGCFLNLAEWEDELPDFDFDIIIYANERWGLDEDHWDNYSVERLKNKYTKAKVVGYIKEPTVPPFRFKNWIRFLNECDTVMAPSSGHLKHLPIYEKIQGELNDMINYCTPCPDNLDVIFNKFYSNTKNNAIFVYTPTAMERRGNTVEFAKYISKKYNIPIVQKPFNPSTEVKQHMSWKDFVELWSPCMWHFNLDPSIEQPGIQTTLVANVGSINIGGMNESHHLLYPETATCDEGKLEDIFVHYLNNSEERFKAIQRAWSNLNIHYGEKVAIKQVLQALGEK
tara:strand:- start:2886 stop:3902 length:1017 start_codon:yes stop_codon:yes gene_type:complete